MAAEKQAFLFENFEFGEKLQDVLKNTDSTACGALDYCSPHTVSFLETEWEEIFTFNNQEELQQIRLRKANNADNFFEIQKRLKSKDWLPIFAQSDNEAFDFIAETRKSDQEESETAFLNFEEKTLTQSRLLEVIFFPEKFAIRILKSKKTQNYYQAEEKYKENTVIVTLARDENHISITFNAPLLSRKNALRYGSFIKRD